MVEIWARMPASLAGVVLRCRGSPTEVTRALETECSVVNLCSRHLVFVVYAELYGHQVVATFCVTPLSLRLLQLAKPGQETPVCFERVQVRLPTGHCSVLRGVRPLEHLRPVAIPHIGRADQRAGDGKLHLTTPPRDRFAQDPKRHGQAPASCVQGLQTVLLILDFLRPHRQPSGP